MMPTAVLHARPDILPKSHARAGLLANSGGEAPRRGGDRRCEAVVGRKSATTGSASVDLPMPIRRVVLGGLEPSGVWFGPVRTGGMTVRMTS
jgi:hypothetical protein